ncbi:MAG: response regulator [Bacteriovoracaceae bacterium]|nr:response regulator [Bacteriovoracaceae bacterium]
MKKILVVDDDKDIGEIISEFLSEYDVTYIGEAKEAIKILETVTFDLVITDLLMPDINGIELTEHIFNNYPKTRVLACSGGGSSGKLVAGMALDQALQEGADNAIMKPFTEEELKAKVSNLLKR